jgi:hypothetical protein
MSGNSLQYGKSQVLFAERQSFQPNSLQYGKSQVLFAEWQSFQPIEPQPHVSLNILSYLMYWMIKIMLQFWSLWMS